MRDGLNIGKQDFEKLPVSQKLNIIYENQVEIARISRGNQFVLKLHTWIIGVISVGTAYLFGFKK